MNLQEARRFLRQNFIFYFTGALAVLGLKCFYRNAACEDLIWILAPIAKWVEILSGIPFEYAPGAGYVNHSLRLLIAPSCSGVQFMIITFAMLTFSFVHRFVHRIPQAEPNKSSILPSGLLKGFFWIIASILISYVFTVLVNGFRILVAIYLPQILGSVVSLGFLTPERLHTMIGIVVYFTALLAVYRLVESVFSWITTLRETKGQRNSLQTHHKTAPTTQKEQAQSLQKEVRPPHFLRKCLSPIFWYFTIALGIPFLNNAGRKTHGKFSEFTILILCCCTVVLTLYGLISFLKSLFKKILPKGTAGQKGDYSK